MLEPHKITGKKILISPLDWGMGHTTRCIVVIRNLIEQGNEVLFAGNQAQCDFISREFDQLKTFFLDGYNVSLDSTTSSYIQMLQQLRKIKNAVKAEGAWVKNFCEQEKVDLIISDNRYGFRHPDIDSIVISHQLNLQLPFLKSLTNYILANHLEKFDAVWIPDNLQNPVCGDLTRTSIDVPTYYMGFLNRFQQLERPVRFNYVCIVSGPEPERSRFAKLLEEFISTQNSSCALVGAESGLGNCTCFVSPSTSELNEIIATSEIVISRAGYTTIMEMASLNKKSILIPTPGQYEQLYLASQVQLPDIIFKTEKEFFRQ